MKQFRLALAALAFLPAAALADGGESAGGCDANTRAEVVRHRPGHRHRGPVVALPGTPCADLDGGRRTVIESLHISVGEPGSSSLEPGPDRGERTRRGPTRPGLWRDGR